MLRLLKRTVAVLLVCTYVVSAYVAWSGITGRAPVPIPDALGGGPKDVSGTDSNFDDLHVERGQGGLVTGSISIENPTASMQDVIVTVDLFDGEQNVAELFGTVTVKPGTASSVELMPIDFDTAWSDAHVDVIRSHD